MKSQLIIDGNAVYEIDMECMENLEEIRRREREESQGNPNGKQSGDSLQKPTAHKKWGRS